MKLTVIGATDTGKAREHNDDSYAIISVDGADPKTEYLTSEQGMLLAVADGMGGTNAGEVASSLAISSVKAYLGKIPDGWSSSPDLIPNALAWAGDSRCYVHRKDELELITHDHSFVQEWVDDGQISYEESLYHSERNYLSVLEDSPKVMSILSSFSRRLKKEMNISKGWRMDRSDTTVKSFSIN